MSVDITSLTRKYARRPLPKANAAYYLWRFVGNGTRTLRAATSRPAHRDARDVASELRRNGIVTAPSDRFLSGSGREALAKAADAVLTASRSDRVEALAGGTANNEHKKRFLVHLASFPAGIPADEPLLAVALDRKLLEIVASYLEMWPSLYSIGAWLNYPTDADAEQSQLWHRDPEDIKVVKVFVYLSDVGEQSGPFTYIPRTHPFGARNAKAHRIDRKARYLADSQMTFPPETWKVCTGPAGTMILADTVGYHRGGKPTAGRRTLVTFAYTSGTPLKDSGLWLRERPRWISSSIQHAAIAWLLDGRRRRARADQ